MTSKHPAGAIVPEATIPPERRHVRDRSKAYAHSQFIGAVLRSVVDGKIIPPGNAAEFQRYVETLLEHPLWCDGVSPESLVDLKEHLAHLHVEIDRNDIRNSVQAVYGDYGCSICAKILRKLAAAAPYASADEGEEAQ